MIKHVQSRYFLSFHQPAAFSGDLIWQRKLGWLTSHLLQTPEGKLSNQRTATHWSYSLDTTRYDRQSLPLRIRAISILTSWAELLLIIERPTFIIYDTHMSTNCSTEQARTLRFRWQRNVSISSMIFFLLHSHIGLRRKMETSIGYNGFHSLDLRCICRWYQRQVTKSDDETLQSFVVIVNWSERTDWPHRQTKKPEDLHNNCAERTKVPSYNHHIGIAGVSDDESESLSMWVLADRNIDGNHRHWIRLPSLGISTVIGFHRRIVYASLVFVPRSAAFHHRWTIPAFCHNWFWSMFYIDQRVVWQWGWVSGRLVRSIVES